MTKKLYKITALVLGLLAVGSNSVLAESALISHYTNNKLTLSVADPVWKNAKAYNVSLSRQMIFIPNGGGSVSEISVKSLHNGKQIAFKVIWNDSTEDYKMAVDKFRDSVAIQFPVKFGNLPSPFMGDEMNPVNIWQWRSDWQAQTEKRNVLDEDQPLTDGIHTYPVDEKILKAYYPAKPNGATNSLEYIASGWGTLTKQEQIDITSYGHYLPDEKKWEVIFLRDIERKDLSDASFEPGNSSYINFAVWNGRNQERNGQKSISMSWIDFKMEPINKQNRR